jgi:hypothetical protein
MDEIVKSYHQLSATKHITVRAQSDVKTENAIDWAIDYALDILANQFGGPVSLASAVPFVCNDGVVFVTVVIMPQFGPEMMASSSEIVKEARTYGSRII